MTFLEEIQSKSSTLTDAKIKMVNGLKARIESAAGCGQVTRTFSLHDLEYEVRNGLAEAGIDLSTVNTLQYMDYINYIVQAIRMQGFQIKAGFDHSGSHGIMVTVSWEKKS